MKLLGLLVILAAIAILLVIYIGRTMGSVCDAIDDCIKGGYYA